jgi:hypothetical protein
MARRRPKLHLVGNDPADVFEDMDALRKAQPETPSPTFQRRYRPRAAEYFARIPHNKGRALGRLQISGTAWWLLVELDRLIFENRNNPVKLTAHSLKAAGISRYAKIRALRQLARTGVISIERMPGRALLVTHHWYPLQ